MMAQDREKSRRVNLMVSEPLVEWASQEADARDMSLSALIRHVLEQERERVLERKLASAAESLEEMYRSDDELTAFTALDGDEFK